MFDTFCSLQTMQTGSFHIVLISLPAACIRNVAQQTKLNAVQKHCPILIFANSTYIDILERGFCNGKTIRTPEVLSKQDHTSN